MRTTSVVHQLVGLVELDLAAVLAENAVEDDEVVMRVDIEGRAEAMKEADGSELGVGGASGLVRWSDQRFASVPPKRAQRDLEHGAGDAHGVVEVGPKTLRNR